MMLNLDLVNKKLVNVMKKKSLKKLYLQIKKRCHWYHFLRYPLGHKFYFFGTPEHINVGDSAIVIAEKLFLKKYFPKISIKELTITEYRNNHHLIQKYYSKRGIAICDGGGNFGTLWYDAEFIRYDLISTLKEDPIIVFPQTVFFSNDEKGKRALENSCLYYESRNNIVLIAREKKSYESLKSSYRDTSTLLVPDIVLSTTMDDFGVKATRRDGILTVFRHDIEQLMSDHDREKIFMYCKREKIKLKKSDMYSGVPVTKENRLMVVRDKMQEFVDAELVITDRLHGMIFAAITETPCIVFSNNHHKISGSYEWISYLPYIQYVTSVQEALDKIPELMKCKNNKYNNEPLRIYYEELARVVGEYVN